MDDDYSDIASSDGRSYAPQSLRQTSQVRPASPIDPMLDSKASQLENEIRQQNTSIKSVLESLKHLEGAQLPSMANTLQNLRTAIERIVVADIPNSLKPIEDDATRVRQKFDKFSSETSNKLQNLHEKLADTSSSIQQLLSRYADLSATTRNSVSEIDSDLQRSKDTLDNAAQRLTALESGLSQADDILRSLKSEIQALTRAFNDKVTQFQNESATTFNATSSQLNNALKSETKVRLQTMAQINQQIQDVNRNTTDAMAKMLTFLTTTKNQYQQALMSLSKAAKDGLLACSSSATDGFGDLNNRMDQFVSDSNTQFESLENDVMSTINALRQHIVSAREGLESAITNVSRARINGETEIVARYDQLKANLSEQLKQQAEHMQEVSQRSVQSVVDHCEGTLSQIREELAQVRGQVDRIARLEARVSQLNASAEQTRAQLADQIATLGQRYAELLASVEKTERDFIQRQEAIESRLSVLEDPDNQPNFASKSELDEIIQRTQQMFDGRLQEIEQQIGQVFANISDLQLTAGRSAAKPSAQSATALLSKLVQNQK
ncbi:hypothetical protein TRFO_39868 [Tritrichomonas foetus]|uniref:Uncharacterized protein n=1 Tax=Tritrichomonas foetus TaxID=1144522 RepID=A0A1J4J3K3_9EUKA|nr:hypothetical protein TRFO_39868 [Tritrichomonas foetus]|eukprot:OHS93938.1 hypothetical protein TRFO_39868 [Tritrichomonas foetus]